MLADIDCGGFAGVVGVSLKCKAPDRDFFTCQSIEHVVDDAAGKASLLGIVHGEDLLPVGCRFFEAVVFAKVNEVEDVFFEAGSTKADAAVKEAWTDARVHTDGVCDFTDVGPSLFAELAHCINGGNALSEEGVGCEFGELGGPGIGGHNTFAGNPMSVDVDDLFEGGSTGRRFVRTDEDAVGIVEIPHCGTFGEELRIRKDFEFYAGSAGCENLFYRIGGTDRDGGFFDDDFVGCRDLSNAAGAVLDKGKVGRTASSDAVGFRRRIDGDEDDICFSDGVINVSRELQVFAADGANDGFEARLKDGQVVGIPGRDTVGIHIDHMDVYFGAFFSDDGHRRAADVTGTDTANFHGINWRPRLAGLKRKDKFALRWTGGRSGGIIDACR